MLEMFNLFYIYYLIRGQFLPSSVFLVYQRELIIVN